jgi:hypothetical protein
MNIKRTMMCRINSNHNTNWKIVIVWRWLNGLWCKTVFLWRLLCLNMISGLQVVHVATVTQVTKMTTKDKAGTTECNPCSY